VYLDRKGHYNNPLAWSTGNNLLIMNYNQFNNSNNVNQSHKQGVRFKEFEGQYLGSDAHQVYFLIFYGWQHQVQFH